MSQEMSLDNSKSLDKNVLNKIHKDMQVHDVDGKAIGRVEGVFLGEVSQEEAETGRGAATASDVSTKPPAETIFNEIAEALLPGEKIPEVLRERLEREGFARMEGKGILGSDRYILPDQIKSVEEGRVNLKVTRDELIER